MCGYNLDFLNITVCVTPRMARYTRKAIHNAWLWSDVRKTMYMAKKTTADTTDDTSMPRVAVVPMKTPSQMKAAIPHSGMSTAQGK